MKNSYIYEQKLVKKLNPEFQSSYSIIRSAVQSFYSYDSPHLVHDFTDHGYDHCLRLITNTYKILNIMKKDFLNENELYLLLIGILLHDIGMQCDLYNYVEIKNLVEKEINEKLKAFSGAKNSAELNTFEQESIRKFHHIITASMIEYLANNKDDTSKLGLAIKTIPKRYLTDLMEICKYHSTLNIINCPTEFKNKMGRKRLIASILRFSDELDISCDRVKIDTVKYYYNINPENSVFWWLHYLTNIKFEGNIITFIILMHPEDACQCDQIVREKVIKKFKDKNENIINILKDSGINIIINYDSDVIKDENIDKLPEDIIKILTRNQMPRIINPLSMLDVGSFININEINLIKLRTLHDKNPEKDIREQLANELILLIYKYGSMQEFFLMEDRLRELKDLYYTYPELKIREKLANGYINSAYEYGKMSDYKKMTTLIDDMKNLYENI